MSLRADLQKKLELLRQHELCLVLDIDEMNRELDQVSEDKVETEEAIERLDTLPSSLEKASESTKSLY